MDQLCHFLPLELETICIEWIQTFGEEIIELIEKEENPDQVCLHLSFCDNPSCSLFGSASSQFIGKYKNKSNQKETPWDWIMERLNQVTKNHLPFIDFDNDKYSTISTLRGANWRGRDCDDGKSEIHPGAKYGDPSVDYNCNGIYGFVPNSKTSYEDLFCKNSQPIGVAILGGSACSHFEIDPKWIQAKYVNESTYQNLLPAIENELDWPHRSWSTGYEASTQAIPVDSVYLHLRERNLCNHRDFQNIGVNGASSNNIVSNVKTLARNSTADQPMLVIYNPLVNYSSFKLKF